MRVKILASGPESPGQQFLVSFLINDTVAIDAGCLGLYGEPRDQARVSDVFLTHSHADHVCSLPTFVMNVHDLGGPGIVVHSHPHVLESLRTDWFNGRVWPDFLKLVKHGVPAIQVDTVVPSRPVSVNGLQVTAVPVVHPVPTVGYILEDDASAVVLCTDTGPTAAIWAEARRLPHLRAVFLGVAFPDELEELAQSTGHLTPHLLRAESAKLPEDVSIIACHIKPAHRDRVVEQLRALRLPRLSIGRCGGEQRF